MLFFSLGKYCKRVVWQNIFGGIFIKASFVIVALVKNNLLWLVILSDVLGLLFVVCNGLRPLYWRSGMGTRSLVTRVEKGEEKIALVASTRESGTKRDYETIISLGV